MKISAATTSPYNWGSDCISWHLVNKPNLSVIQERMPAGSKEKLHYHKQAAQFFFILQGNAPFFKDGIKYELTANEGILVEPGEVHFIENVGPSTLEFIVISQPHAHGDRVDQEQ